MPDSSRKEKLQTWMQVLRDRDLRLTQARLAVMNIMVRSSTPLTARKIYDRARKTDQSLGMASVYRTLEVLSELDLIQLIHQPQGCQAYAPSLTGHQHFIICTACGRMAPFEGRDEVSDFFREVGEKRGYQVQDHWLQVFGMCRLCQ